MKMSVSIPDADIATLKEIAAERDITFVQALRQAIATEAYLHQERRRGGKVLIEHDKKLRELVFR